MNNNYTIDDILKDDFDISKISFDEFKKIYREAAKKYYNNDSIMIQLNSLNEMMKRRNYSFNDTNNYKYDGYGNIEYIPNTNIPKARDRKLNETDEEYIEFLKNYYEQAFSKSKTTENVPALPPHQDSKQNTPYPALPPHVEPPKSDEPPQKGNSSNNTQSRKPRRRLERIINDITKGLDIRKSDGRKYKASNIKVAKEFKKELKSGNYLYNIVHFVPAIIKVPIKWIIKQISKPKSKGTKETLAILKRRVDNLSEEDLDVIEREYRGTRRLEERYPTVLDMMLNEKIQERANRKVEKLNQEIANGYKHAFATYRELQAIDRELHSKKIDSKTRDDLLKYRRSILAGQAKLIADIRDKKDQAEAIYSGGAHGFSEDTKAARTQLSLVGKRFAKKYDFDHELSDEKARLEDSEEAAIAAGDDEAALESFIALEQLKSGNTEINRSIFGKRSEGKKYYSPLVEQLDYRDDPFIRDIFTTVAIVGSTVGALNAIKAKHDADQINSQLNDVNAANNATMDRVHEIGRDISGKRETFQEGMNAQIHKDVTGISDVTEISGLQKLAGGDPNKYWDVTDPAYKSIDDAGHAFYNGVWNDTKKSIEDIASQYGNGAITQAEALHRMADLSSKTNATFASVGKNSLEILETYSKAHPQFDWTAVKETLHNVVDNADKVSHMNQAMVDVTDMGDVLTGLTMEQAATLSSLPSDLQTTLIGAASAAALAFNVSSTMTANQRKGKYGNEITRMVEESMYPDAGENKSNPTK